MYRLLRPFARENSAGGEEGGGRDPCALLCIRIPGGEKGFIFYGFSVVDFGVGVWWEEGELFSGGG